jgi:hypothetical protein
MITAHTRSPPRLKSLLRASALSFSSQAPKRTLKRRWPTNHSPLHKVKPCGSQLPTGASLLERHS